jgi:hypothetical protein
MAQINHKIKFRHSFCPPGQAGVRQPRRKAS